MTYWIYDPKKLATPSTLIPYRQKDLGDFLNFLSILCVFIYAYLTKTNNIENYKNIIMFFLVGIFFTGLVLGNPPEKNINP